MIKSLSSTPEEVPDHGCSEITAPDPQWMLIDVCARAHGIYVVKVEPRRASEDDL